MNYEDQAEKKYIAMRKRRAFFESLCFYICRIFPVRDSKIVLWTGEGNGGYCDSPKYIAEELLKREKEGGRHYDFLWLTNHPEKEFPKNIKTAPYSLWSRAYHLTTAKYWVSNTRSVYGTQKRKGTKYVMTWHAIAGIKPVGRQRGDKFPKMAEIVSEADSTLIDYIPIGSEWGKENQQDGLLYYTPFLETGIPRCDILLSDKKHVRERVRTRFGLEEDAQIVMYAPTFRGGSQKGTRSVAGGICAIDVKRVIEAYEQRFGGKWYLFLRLHPQVAEQMTQMQVSEKHPQVIDVSQVADMSELLAAIDSCITDYSSVIYEAALMKKPSFFYIDDYDEYVEDRGELMVDVRNMAFPFAKNMDDFISNIIHFDAEEYKEKCELLLREFGFFETGHATEKLVDTVFGKENSKEG